MSPNGSFPGGASGKELSCQRRRLKRCKFNPWAGKIPWRRKWQLTAVFLPVESPWTEKPGGLQSIAYMHALKSSALFGILFQKEKDFFFSNKFNIKYTVRQNLFCMIRFLGYISTFKSNSEGKIAC